jgi:hypothetical protein
MVNLAGCSGGVGDTLRGDNGVSSLENAFQIAGVQLSLSCKWDANSVMTSHLMADFYRDFLNSSEMDASRSLRSAKLEMLHHGPASDSDHPYYWAGWRTTGSPYFNLSSVGIEAQGGKPKNSRFMKSTDGLQDNAEGSRHFSSPTLDIIRLFSALVIGLVSMRLLYVAFARRRAR